jgi:hypothetical protein
VLFKERFIQDGVKMENNFKCSYCNADNDRTCLICRKCNKSLVVARLECVEPFENMVAGTVFELLPLSYSIGRGSDNHIVITDKIVSRHHLELICNLEEKLFHVHLLGQNRQDFEKETYKLFDGAVIPVGKGSFKFNYIKRG